MWRRRRGRAPWAGGPGGARVSSAKSEGCRVSSPRLAREPARRALTRWCAARGGEAVWCAGRRCRLGGAACHAASPVRAAPERRPAGRPPAAGQPSGVLMASPRTVSGRASAERGRGRSQRAYFGGGRLTGCCRDSDRPHATRPGPPAAAAHHRQSGDSDRIPAARRAQRPAHGRPLRESDRHHRAPGISRSWQPNGRITTQ